MAAKTFSPKGLPAAKPGACGACFWHGCEREEPFRQRSFPPGEIILREGELPEAVALIRSGMAKLYQTLSGGRRQMVGFALAGEALFLAAGPSDVTAEAVDRVQLCLLDRSALDRMLMAEPAVAQRLLASKDAELARLRRHLAWIGRQTAEERISSFLLDLHRREAKLSPGDTEIRLPMSRQDIADHLGLAIETVSRVLGRLAAEGSLAVVPGGVRLLDPMRLAAGVVPPRAGQAPRYRSWKRPG